MRYSLLVLGLLLALTTSLHAQTFGGRIGYGSLTLESTPVSVQSPSTGIDTFALGLNDNSSSIYAGFFYRQPILPFLFVEGEALMAGYDYPVTIERPEWNGGQIIKHERMISSDLSLAAGFRLFRTIRVQGGVKGHYLFDARERMTSIEPAYQNDWDAWTTSYFGTIGLDLVNLTLDFTYGTTTQGLGDNPSAFGSSYSWSGRRETFAVKLGLRIAGRQLQE